MLDLGLQLAVDARTVCFVEREAPSAEILAARMHDGILEDAPIWSDLTTFDGRPWRGLVDIVAGGIPCQPFSVAGKQAGNDDERALAPHLLRIVGECLPSVVFVENVPPWVSRGYARELIVGLHNLGYEVAEPLFLKASDFGATHKRERVFVMAYREGGEARNGNAGSADGGGFVGNAESPERRPNDLGCRSGREGIDREREAASRSTESGSRVGDSCGSRLEGSIHGTDDGFSQPWPPSPSADWTGIPESLWPAQAEPRVRGVVDGHMPRVDRLRACGNGVVPVVAAYAFRALMETIK